MDPQPPALFSAGGWSGNTLREQILLHPGGYIGSVEKRSQKLWVREGVYMRQRVVTYAPGLLKIFDEILLNAADVKQHDPAMNILRVEINVAKGSISVYNNGKGIPIEIHLGEGVYLPEVFFGHLSTAPKLEEEGITGVKLANIFSTEFVVEIADGPSQKKYKQVFSENMGERSEPEITGHRKGVNWTMVTFKPDLARFHMAHLNEDIIDLMRKRVFDMAGIFGGTVQVVFNGQTIGMSRGFQDYVSQCINPVPFYRSRLPQIPWVYEVVNDRWEVAATVSSGEFQQISFVNKVATISGGTHVDYVSNLIVSHAMRYMKDTLQLPNIEEHNVKRHLMVLINACLENPTFSSLSKEALTTPKEYFGSELVFSKLFLNRASFFLCHKLKGLPYV